MNYIYPYMYILSVIDTSIKTANLLKLLTNKLYIPLLFCFGPF